MVALIILILQVLSFLVLARAILSWLRTRPDTALGRLAEGVRTITEPVLAPVRRVLPSPGGIDLSPLVVILGINLLAIPVVASL